MSRTTARALMLASAAAGAFGLATVAVESAVDACGCFTPPDPSVPIVQAGERIAFEMNDGVVTSHIQIQYAGAAEEFGWLLPLPSVPELEVGTDELFTQLIAQTQPAYRLVAEYHGNCAFDPSRQGGGNGASSDSSGEDSPPSEDPDSPLVIQDSIGPYDYAVLRADSKQPMLDWLAANRFFVPAGTDDAVDPYIRPGAYFLALKLRKGNDVGDIQPVVVRYQSDLPMIPLVLTSVAADPDMAVQVWVLGAARAIPRNFYHTRINDAEIDWLTFGSNYADVVTRAVDEAEGHHSFVTEYAGTSAVMRDILDYPGRFGDLGLLRATSDAVGYVDFLNWNGYPVATNQPPFFQATYGSQLLAILGSHLPVPVALLADGITASDYYVNISYYLGAYRTQNPDKFADLDVTFDPSALTDEIEERIVRPIQAAGEMFRRHDYLTRMFTTLSPEEMTRDPAFSFNPDLAEVSNLHVGRIHYYCGIVTNDDPATTPATIVTEDGFELEFPDGTGDNPWDDVTMPWSRYTELLREEGAPEVVSDNTDAIVAALATQDDGGCAAGGGITAGGGLLLAVATALIRRRRQG